MPHCRFALCLVAALFAFAPPTFAQRTAEKLETKGWKKVALKKGKRLDYTQVTSLTPKHVFELQFVRAEGWHETVVTGDGGAIWGRSDGEHFEFAPRQIGDRYSIWLSRPKARQCLLFRECFIEYPNRDFPAKGWNKLPDGDLKLKRTKQFTPKTMFEAFDKPHGISFKPPKRKRDAVYLLTHVVAGEPEKVESQTMTGSLEFSWTAKKGETFRIYEIFPEDKTYRATAVMTVEKDYPMGK